MHSSSLSTASEPRSCKLFFYCCLDLCRLRALCGYCPRALSPPRTFSPPSFSATASGANLTGGGNNVATALYSATAYARQTVRRMRSRVQPTCPLPAKKRTPPRQPQTAPLRRCTISFCASTARRRAAGCRQIPRDWGLSI